MDMRSERACGHRARSPWGARRGSRAGEAPAAPERGRSAVVVGGGGGGWRLADSARLGLRPGLIAAGRPLGFRFGSGRTCGNQGGREASADRAND